MRREMAPAAGGSASGPADATRPETIAGVTEGGGGVVEAHSAMGGTMGPVGGRAGGGVEGGSGGGFLNGVHRGTGEGKRCVGYDFFKFVSPQYIHRLTDECIATYIYRLTDEYIGPTFFG
jgi:hypothetical protein